METHTPYTARLEAGILALSCQSIISNSCKIEGIKPMSMEYCHECGTWIDTDYDSEHFDNLHD